MPFTEYSEVQNIQLYVVKCCIFLIYANQNIRITNVQTLEAVYRKHPGNPKTSNAFPPCNAFVYVKSYVVH